MIDSALLRRFGGPAVALLGSVGLWHATARGYDPAALAAAEQQLLSPLQTPFTHRFVQAGKHQIHTLVGGEGPPLVMLHGHGGGVGVWLNNLDLLARHFRVYALDWLGWGRSERPSFPGRHAEAARNWWLNGLEDWRRAVGLTDFYLLGHSLGGWLAAEYALVFGQHVRHLILENPAGLVPDVTLHKSLYYLLSPQRMVQAIGPLGPWLVGNACAEEAASCAAGKALLAYYYQLSVAPLSGQVAFEKVLLPNAWSLPLFDRADSLAVRTTLLWGLQDDMFRFRHAHQFIDRLPHGQLVPLVEAAHSPHSDHAAAFNEAMVRLRYEQGERALGQAS